MANVTDDYVHWCHWGAFHAAILIEIDSGLYRMRYADGTERWCVASELAITDNPLPAAVRVPLHHVVLVPGDDQQTYRRATLIAFEDTSFTVCFDESGAQHRMDRDDARLPLGPTSICGTGSLPLLPGARLHCVRGSWLPCTIVRSDASHAGGSCLGHLVQLQPTGTSQPIEVWVDGGLLARRIATAHDLASDEQATNELLVGSTALLLPVQTGTQTAVDAMPREVRVQRVQTDGTALVLGADGREEHVRNERIAARLETAYRVLVATGGHGTDGTRFTGHVLSEP